MAAIENEKVNAIPATATRRIIIVTHPNGFFGRLSYGWESVDVSQMVVSLSELFHVQVVSIDRLFDFPLQPSDVVIYSSSDEPNIRQFYKDVFLLIRDKANIVPAIEFLFAHENKGFQEIHKERLGLTGLAGQYLFDWDQLRVPAPFVFKRVDGAGSSGVQLVPSNKAADKIFKTYYKPKLLRRFITLARVRQLNREKRDMYKYRHKGFLVGVAQEFVPGLVGDQKVLVFGDNYYVLDRSVKKGDFRASGSGLFEFSKEPQVAVLDYARKVFQKLKVPYVSLDVVTAGNGDCALIEYQAVHFGPYTLLRSPGHFRLVGNEWKFFEYQASLEVEMANAIKIYLERHASTHN